MRRKRKVMYSVFLTEQFYAPTRDRRIELAHELTHAEAKALIRDAQQKEYHLPHGCYGYKLTICRSKGGRDNGK